MPVVLLEAGTLIAGEVPESLSLKKVHVGGDLLERLHRNYDRLEEPHYQPDEVFLSLEKSGNWPGDKEGRVLLGVTLEAQATHRTPKYLTEILRRFPEKFNAKGYFGNICPSGLADEQQLSGHGWVLRGISEYYLWKQDARCLDWLNAIVDNLALPTRRLHAEYPIDPTQRKSGGKASGSISRQIGAWLVSTDVGCDFIFLDGLVQAYQITGRQDLKPIIDEMVQRYQQMDLRAIKAQTHAALTGMRGLLRYYEITHDPKLLRAVVDRFDLYRRYALTENYENYNWFGRPEWTEPCAVVDSYLVAIALWRWTGDPDYLNFAQRVYYNALCYEQRANGGFGTQKCAGAGTPILRQDCQEASWCCTMRGGEGLAQVAQSLCFQISDGLQFVHFNDATLQADFTNRGSITLKEQTAYPFTGSVQLTVVASSLDFAAQLQFFTPVWAENVQVSLNGRPVPWSRQNDFAVVRKHFRVGDVIRYECKLRSGRFPGDGVHGDVGFSKLYYGPLLLGCATNLAPVLPEVCEITMRSPQEFRVTGLDTPFQSVYSLIGPRADAEPARPIRVLFNSEIKTAQSAPPSR